MFINKKILFSIASLVIFFSTIEILVRVFSKSSPAIPIVAQNPTATSISEESKEGLFIYSPDYIYRLKSNLIEEYTRASYNGGEKIIWHTDQFGNRGLREDYEYDRSILVFGDSNIQARFSEHKNTFCYQLEEELKHYRGSPKVINIGTVGFGPDQNLIRLLRDFKKNKPRLVIFHIFADNDFGDIIRNQLIDINKQGALYFSNVDKRDLFIGSEQIRSTPNGLTPIVLHLESLEYFYTQMVFNGRLKRLQEEFSLYQEKNPSPTIFLDHYDIDVATDPYGEIAQYKIKLMKAIFIELKKYSDTNSIPTVLLIQPSSTDISTNMSLNYLRLQSNFDDYHPKNQVSILESLATEVGLDFISLWSPFQSNNPNLLYFKGINNHWNDKGQKIAAKEVSKTIKQRDW